MKSLRTLTLAATLALIGMAGGYAGDARAQTDNLVTQANQPVVGIGMLVPAVQPVRDGDGAPEIVTGAGKGAGKPGEANALIGLLRPGENTAITDGTKPSVNMPTDRVNGDGVADLVTGAGKGGGTQAGLAKTGTGTLTLSGASPTYARGANTYTGTTTINEGVLQQKGSLSKLGSINDLFANSRGGDQSAGAHGSGGGGGAGKVSMRDTFITDGTKGPDGLSDAGNGDQPAGAHGAGGAGKIANRLDTTPPKVALLLPAVQAAREAARSSGGTSAAAGGGQIASNAAKTMTIQNSARK